MAKTKSKTRKEDSIEKKLMDLGLGIGGGIVANQVSNFIEKQSFIQGYEKLVPLFPMALGIIGYIVVPKELRPAAFGMAVISGAEAAETAVSETIGLMSGNGQFKLGYAPTKQLGFVPQIQTSNDMSIATAQGTMVR